MSVRVLHLVVLAAAVSCSDGVFDPTPPGGARYVLRSIDGQSLPAEYAANPDFHGVMIADTLFLREDGTGTLQGTVTAPSSTSPLHQSSGLYVESSGNNISVSMVCPPNAALANCIAPPHFVGRVTSDGIVFTESQLFRTPLVFERVP